MNPKLTYILLMIVFCCTASCGDSDMQEKMESLSPQTLEIGEDFFKNRQNNNFFAVQQLFSESFYLVYTSDHVQITLDNIKNRHGELLKYDLVRTTRTTNVTNGERHDYIINHYKVFYSSGFVATEELKYEIPENAVTIGKIDGYFFGKFSPEEQKE